MKRACDFPLRQISNASQSRWAAMAVRSGCLRKFDKIAGRYDGNRRAGVYGRVIHAGAGVANDAVKRVTIPGAVHIAGR